MLYKINFAGAVAITGVVICGCGGRADSPQSTAPTIAKPAAIEPSQIAFGAYCTTLPENNVIKAGGYDVISTRLDVWISTPKAEKVKQVFTSTANMNPANGFQVQIPSVISDTSAIQKTVADNYSGYLLFECQYIETRAGTGRTMTLSSLNKISDLVGNVTVVSPLTEILRQVYSKAAQVGNSASNLEQPLRETLQQRFGLNRIDPIPIADVDTYSKTHAVFVSDGSPYMVANRAIFADAQQFVANDFSAYAQAVAKSVVETCTNEALCMFYRPNKTTVLTANSNFSDSSLGWQKFTSVRQGRIFDFKFGLDGVATASLLANEITTGGFDRIELYQRLLINGSQLKSHALHFIVDNVVAGTELPFVNGVASGIAGAYLCFENSTEAFGCYLFGHHYDAIQIPIKIGLAFDIKSDSSLYYDYSRETRGIRYLNLDMIAENLPKVRSNKDQITSVRYGIIATEAAASHYTRCPSCFSSVAAKTIALERAK